MSSVTAAGLAACNAASGSSSATGIYTPGTYTATAKGMSEITATVTFDANTITKVELDLSGETESIGGAAKDKLIEQIMNAKPEDRRAIFEEATGIIVFKNRKQEIERKLGNSYNNLNIFMQRMGEVEHMLAPLQRQAVKTKKYRELYDELKENEINLYIYKHDTAESSKSAIHAVLDDLHKQIAEGREQAENLERKYGDDRRRIAESDELLQRLNEEILKYTLDLQKKEGDVNLIRERINFYREQRESDEKFLSDGAKRLEEIAAELSAAESSSKENGGKMREAQKESSTLGAEIASLNEKLSEYEELNDKSQKSVIDSIENLSEIRQNIGTLSAKKENKHYVWRSTQVAQEDPLLRD